MIDQISTQMKLHIDKTIDAFKKQLASIRTGRANTGLIEGVRVDYYGNPSPISQIANINIPDAKTLVVKPWEKNMLKAIEKAINEANLGLMAMIDGDLVRIPVPALTEERRKEFVKQARLKAEEAKLAIRNSRRDSNELLKTATKDGDISEDDEKRGLKHIQDATDSSIVHIDDLLKKKEEEIMTV